METIFACDMSAMTENERARHRSLAGSLRPAIVGVDELDDGYAARFDMDPERLLALAEFVTLERLCCPWLTLAVEAERDGGALRLRITAAAGAKPSIRHEFGFT